MPDDITEIHVHCQEFEEFFTIYAEQIGRGEVFVRTREILPVETPVELAFFVVYNDLLFFKTSGVISYVVDPGQSDTEAGKEPGMGVKIEDIDGQIREFVISLVKSQLKNELSRMFTT